MLHSPLVDEAAQSLARAKAAPVGIVTTL